MSKGRYRYEAPVDLTAPPPASAPPPPIRQRPNACNCGDIDCMVCWNAGVRYADYEKQKRLEKL